MKMVTKQRQIVVIYDNGDDDGHDWPVHEKFDDYNNDNVNEDVDDDKDWDYDKMDK